MRSIGPLVRALRPRQWVKNVLVFAAPAAAGSLDEAHSLGQALAGFAIFTCAAAAIYLANDVQDVALDRRHPTKRNRPIASGAVSVRTATIVAVVLASIALATSFSLAWQFGVIVTAYLGINIWYSTGMKHIPGLELGAIASGFVLRALAGGAVTDTPLSGWFVAVLIAGSLFVVAGKRSAELTRVGPGGGRAVLKHYQPRQLLALRVLAAAGAVVAYGLWVIAQDLANNVLAALSLLPFAAALARYSLAVDSGLGEDPEEVMAADRGFQLVALLWLGLYGAAVYA